jgi:DNA-directed RNA polymerase sigma subunit (sigma70/sigma32)
VTRERVRQIEADAVVAARRRAPLAGISIGGEA